VAAPAAAAGKPAASYAEMREVVEDIKSDLRYEHELNGCLNCGIRTATCPSAHFYDFSPREIVQLLWTENVEQIYDAMQEKIWACAQCMTCAARCPFKNSPGGLIAIMREASIKHGMQSAKDVLRPFGRVMLKLITTGNQLSPDMIQPDHFPDWGPNIQKVQGDLKTLRKAIPLRTLQTTACRTRTGQSTSKHCLAGTRKFRPCSCGTTSRAASAAISPATRPRCCGP